MPLKYINVYLLISFPLIMWTSLVVPKLGYCKKKKNNKKIKQPNLMMWIGFKDNDFYCLLGWLCYELDGKESCQWWKRVGCSNLTQMYLRLKRRGCKCLAKWLDPESIFLDKEDSLTLYNCITFISRLHLPILRFVNSVYFKKSISISYLSTLRFL